MPSGERASLQSSSACGERQVPVAARRRLVDVEPGVHAQRHLRVELGEVDVAGRLIDRVRAEHEQRRDAAAPRCRERDRGTIRRLAARSSATAAMSQVLADIAERLVDLQRERLQLRRRKACRRSAANARARARAPAPPPRPRPTRSASQRDRAPPSHTCAGDRPRKHRQSRGRHGQAPSALAPVWVGVGLGHEQAHAARSRRRRRAGRPRRGRGSPARTGPEQVVVEADDDLRRRSSIRPECGASLPPS